MATVLFLLVLLGVVLLANLSELRVDGAEDGAEVSMSKLAITNVNLHDLHEDFPNSIETLDSVIHSLGSEAAVCLDMLTKDGAPVASAILLAGDLLVLRGTLMAMSGDRLGAIDQLKRAQQVRSRVTLRTNGPSLNN